MRRRKRQPELAGVVLMLLFGIGLLVSGTIAIVLVCWLVQLCCWIWFSLFPPSPKAIAKQYRQLAKKYRRNGSYAAALALEEAAAHKLEERKKDGK